MKALDAVEFVADYGNEYAKSYAQAWLSDWNQVTFGWAETQLYYILSNFTHCRAKGHKEVRAKLKEMLVMARNDQELL